MRNKLIKKEILSIFVIAFIIGILGQTLIPLLSSKITIEYLKFDVLISNIDIYSFIIVFFICYKNPQPKQCFYRIFVFFVGLCLGYYGYTSCVDMYKAITVRPEYLTNILSDFVDSLEYIIISIFAGVWGYIMIKYQSNKTVFFGMALPFIIVNIISFYENIFVCNPMKLFMGITDILLIIAILICLYRKYQNYKLQLIEHFKK